MIVQETTEKGRHWRWIWLDERLSDAEQEEWDRCLAFWDVVVRDPEKISNKLILLGDNPMPRFAGRVGSAEMAKKFEELFEDEFYDRFWFNQGLGSGDVRWSPPSLADIKAKLERDFAYRYHAWVAAIRDLTRRAANRMLLRRGAEYGHSFRNPKSADGNAAKTAAATCRLNAIEALAKANPDFDPRKGSTEYWYGSLGARLRELWGDLSQAQIKKDKAKIRLQRRSGILPDGK